MFPATEIFWPTNVNILCPQSKNMFTEVQLLSDMFAQIRQSWPSTNNLFSTYEKSFPSTKNIALSTISRNICSWRFNFVRNIHVNLPQMIFVNFTKNLSTNCGQENTESRNMFVEIRRSRAAYIPPSQSKIF